MGLSPVVRQIELHPSGTFNEIVFHRSGVRLDVVIGTYIAQRGELTLLVDGLPLAENRTVVSVAHRLATAEAADIVLVFDGGRLVEMGSHAELVSRGGVYHDLHAAWSLTTVQA